MKSRSFAGPAFFIQPASKNGDSYAVISPPMSVPASKTWFRVFLLLYAVWGFFSINEYGVPLDELTQRHIGIVNNKYISGTGTATSLQQEGPFGPVFESVSYLLEQCIYSQPLRHKLLLRHTLLFLLFLLTVQTTYSIGKRIFKTPNVAGITAISLALYPPLFAHAHYNSKDTFFLNLIVFSLWFFIRFSETKQLKFLFLFALISGMAATIRITGFLSFAIITSGLLLRREIPLNKAFRFAGIALLVCLVSFFMLLPMLWANPVTGLTHLLQYSTNNPWPSPTLCAGQLIYPGLAPWWYLPVWMLVTVPVVSIILAGIGMAEVIRKPVLRNNSLLVTLLLLLLVPMILVMAMRPTLYDGWRHFQFLIVPIILISGIGLQWLLTTFNSRIWSWAVAGYATISCLFWHPFEYVYFNEIYSAAFSTGTFNQDYWGLSSQHALKWIHSRDSRSHIRLYSFTESPSQQLEWMDRKLAEKFEFVSQNDSADYEIELKRAPWFGSTKGREVFSICPMKDTIVRVIQFR